MKKSKKSKKDDLAEMPAGSRKSTDISLSTSSSQRKGTFSGIGKAWFGIKSMLKKEDGEHSIYVEEDSDDDDMNRENTSPTPRIIPRCKETDPEELEQILKLNQLGLLPLIAEGSEGFSIEVGTPDIPNSKRYEYSFQDAEKDFYYYNTFFFGKEHDNYVGYDEGGVGPIVLSIESNPEDNGFGAIKAIIRTKEGDKRVLIHGNKERKQKAIQAGGLKLTNPQMKFKLVKDKKLEQELNMLETQQVEFQRNYKFGVLDCITGQTENEMFANDGSPDFEEFLDFLGTRITLEGWAEFRGGLDCKTNTTGKHSVFTKFHNFNIMFHVSSLLPFSNVDPQQVERKRHIGNDVILIVFKEGDAPFVPKVITSNFNNIIFVVSKLRSQSGETYYRVATTEKVGIGPSAPLLPEIPIFRVNEGFREFFLMKLINAERMAMHSREFENRLKRARAQQLKLLYTQFKD